MEISLACYRMKRLPISGKPSSVDDNDGCSQGLRSNSVTGSLAPSQTRPPCRPRHSLSRFILLVSSFRVRAVSGCVDPRKDGGRLIVKTTEAVGGLGLC